MNGLTMGENGVTNIQKGMAVIRNQSKNYSQPIQTYQEGSPYQNQSYQDGTPYQPISAPKPTKINRSFADTILYAKAVKSAYRVNEPIRIQLKLKRDAYIYFWTISQDGRGYLILPNSFDGSAKHKANRHYVIPHNSADYQFVSNRAGIENLYVLATNKRISRDKIESIFNQKVGGVIPRATARNINQFVTKDLLVIAKKQNLKYDIKHFSIKVLGNRRQIQKQNRPQSNRQDVNIYINR
ncbi:MAG TPA: DUF4384 domain-containing protein [Campylobacterales bacterium]|nr:DUF4384 domain-containing protein [Campylobacterales bacterium]